MGSILCAYVLPHPPIIVPEIGRGKEMEAKATVDACIKVAEDVAARQPDTVIVISPHGLSLADAICITVLEDIRGDFRNFGRKDLKLEFDNDLELLNKILEKSVDAHFPLEELDENAITRYDITPVLDHGAMVPLYYIKSKYPKFKIIHISMGFLDYEYLTEFGELLKGAINESSSNCVLISSGDLSHKLTSSGPYGYNKYGEIFDNKIVEILKNGKFKELLNIEKDIIEESAQCGLRSFITMAASLNENPKSEVLSYEGPFGVGYCVAKIENGK